MRALRGPRPYIPWKRSQRAAFVARFVLPPVLIVGLSTAGAPWPHVAGAALTSYLVGHWMHRRVRSRQYGMQLEKSATARACTALRSAGLRVETNRMSRVGDIDIIVTGNAANATVEIKSFHFWRGRFRDRTRQRKARAQAMRQKKVAGTSLAVIWLPNARTNWLSRLLDALLPERAPYVVRGSARNLASFCSTQLGGRTNAH